MNGTTDFAGSTSLEQTEPYASMDHEELCKQYACSIWNNRGLTSDEANMSHVATVTKASEEARANAPFSLDITYGQSDKTRMDILLPDSLPIDCPILIFIHGGYWQLLGREMSSYPALPVYNAGGGFVSVGYDLAPSVTLREIVGQIKSAVEYVMHLAQRRGSRGVYVCGHSAGAQLAAMMLAVDWMNEALVSPGLLKGAALLSGIFDVRPLVDTPENDGLKLTKEEAWDLSPCKHADTIVRNSKMRTIHTYVGAHDSPEFQRQSKQFHKTLVGGGICTKFQTVPDADHFTLVERVTEPDYTVTKGILSMMGLKQASP